MFLCCHIFIWVHETCNSRYWYLVLSLLSGFLFLGFCFLSCIGGCGVCLLLGKKFFWDPARWLLIFIAKMNYHLGMGLCGACWGIYTHGPPWSASLSGKRGRKCRKATMEVVMRLVGWIWVIDSEAMRLAYMLSWPTCFFHRFDWQVPRECLLEFKGRTIGWLERKFGQEDLSDPLEMGAESIEGTWPTIELRARLGDWI